MKEIADSAYRFQQKLDTGDRVFVGLNAFTEQAPGSKIEILKIGPEFEVRQKARLTDLKKRRDPALVENSLRSLKDAMAAGKPSFR